VGARLVARDIGLSYGPSRDNVMPVLDLDCLCVEAGELVGVTGPSGSGKTSLLHVLAGLERPQRGVVLWDGIDILSLPEADRDHWRRRTLGFVFQDFHLFSGLSALDNVLLPATFEHAVIPGGLRRRARELLAEVRVPEGRTPVERLSRGEMQRVALARALLFAPPVVVADEPTASLDAESARLVGGLLVAMARGAGSTALVVTHDPGLLARVDPTYLLVEGRLASAAVTAAS
jgi:putative ABC transport system ATP-binding protein